MKLKISLVVISLIMSLPINAKMIQNTKAVEAYEKYAQPSKELLYELQETIKASDTTIQLYKNLGHLTVEVPAVGKHLGVLADKAKEIYGDNPEQFRSCASLPMVASLFWSERLSGIKKDNTEMVNNVAARYVSLAKECVNSINNRPPKMIDESEELQIIEPES
ncbi:hypothetical protein OHJ28_13570 [Dickeya fangzhongdai]|uniref:hypothetical protein n=1 Tax=Dickeya fangzhongdai TaxID=1778540 RepID=UPI00330747DE